MCKASVLCVAAFMIVPVGNLYTQFRSGDFTILAQATASFADRTYDFSQVGSREIRQDRSQEYYLAICPTYWTGEHTAIEIEMGFKHSSWEQLYDIWSYPISDNAILFIPHLLVSPGVLDSVLLPYIRGGIGFADNYTTPLITNFGEDLRGEIATVYSLGAGAMYLAGSRVFFRGELNYRAHRSEGGSNTSLKINWSAYNVFFGIGFRF